MKPERRELIWKVKPEELFAGLSERRGAFFLDSGLSMNGLGRYSFIGFDPFQSLLVREGRCELKRGGHVERSEGDPLELLKRLLREFRCERTKGIPFPGGAVGFLSYEFGSGLEKVVSGFRDGELDTPDLEFGFYDGVLMYDNKIHQWSAVALPSEGRTAEDLFCCLTEAGVQAMSTARAFGSGSSKSGAREWEIVSSVSHDEYLGAIEKIKGYIASGDVYQVNLTYRNEVPLRCRPYELYLDLRRRSPAPFACFFRADKLVLISSSPERFLQVQGNRVETRPIKGTRRRSADSVEDGRLARELASSAKDRAELLMIVDLERNDLGRVCVAGSVTVEELFRVEHHPTVHHFVAAVSGELRGECDAIDCIRAAFPGGSITGAPKIRAMQIIAELERTRRGVYTGAMGYLGFDGDCDLNIAIRTVICSPDKAYYHVGGGIVWDSEPTAEYQETLDKGAAMRGALFETPMSSLRYETLASFDGRQLPAAELKVSVLGDGFMYGHGLFETIKVQDGAMVFFSDHWARLSRSAMALGFELRGDEGSCRERCEALVKANGLINGNLKVILCQDVDQTVEFILARKGLYPAESYKKGFRLVMEHGYRRGSLAAFKTLNYYDCIAAKRRAAAAGFDEPIFVTESGCVLEGATTNIFLVKEQRLVTPPADGRLLPGVARARVLGLAGGQIVERLVTEQELLEADEVFVTNALLGVMPVAAIAGRTFDLERNPVTRKVAAQLAALR